MIEPVARCKVGLANWLERQGNPATHSNS